MSKVILNPDRITGRAKVNAPVAVVGVGARDGLGGALSYRVAQAGYHVVMCGRTEAKMQNTKEKIELEDYWERKCHRAKVHWAKF